MTEGDMLKIVHTLRKEGCWTMNGQLIEDAKLC